MTSTTNYAGWILFAVILAAVKPSAATRELSTSPTAATSQDKLWQWLQITAVPLGVFLMGACIWGCINSSVVWRSLLKLITCERRGASIAPGAEAMPAAGPVPNVSTSQHGSDMEEGNAVLDRRNVDGNPSLICAEDEGNPSGVRAGRLAPSL